jgi:hypothetical protein
METPPFFEIRKESGQWSRLRICIFIKRVSQEDVHAASGIKTPASGDQWLNSHRDTQAHAWRNMRNRKEAVPWSVPPQLNHRHRHS